MEHWFDQLTRCLARRPLDRRTMLLHSAKLGLALVGAGLAGRLPQTASAAPADAGVTTSCTVTDTYGVLTVVATTTSTDPPTPLTMTHNLLAEIGSGMVFSTLAVSPGTGAAGKDDVVLRMNTSSLPDQRASADVTLGRRFTGADVQRSSFSTDGHTIEGHVNGQPVQTPAGGRRIGTTGIALPAPQPGVAASPEAGAMQRAASALIGQAIAQAATCSPDPRSSREVATCTQCQLTCRQAWNDCALPAVQRALASGVTAPGEYLAIASATCNPALQQCLSTCKSSGACCPSFCNGNAACCATSWGCCPPSSRSSPQWSRVWPTCPRCGPPPWTVASTKVTPTPMQACTPRPPIAVTTRPAGPGALQVTLTVSRSPSLTNNTLGRVEIGAARNANVVIGGQTQPASGVAVPVAPGSESTTFIVQRQTPGQPTMVPLTVTDACGPWSTFVGGGPTAF